VVRTIKALRDSGCPLQRIRGLREQLLSEGHTLRDTLVVWDGQELFTVDNWQEVRARFRRPHQLAFFAVVLPIADWQEDMGRSLEDLDSRREAIRRAKQAGSRRSRTMDLGRPQATESGS
jgi:hypothetical protein